MEYKIFYPTPPEAIDDIENDNIDVCIKANGRNYTLVFITPDNLKTLMKSWNENFISPSFKYVVVENIKREYIEKAVDDIIKTPELLEFYGL